MSDQAKVLDALADGEQSVTELAVTAGLPVGRTATAVLSLHRDRRVQWQVVQGTRLWRLA